jgi:cytochrome c5
MNKRMTLYISIVLVVILAGTLLASCSSKGSSTPTSTGGSAPSGPASGGQALMQERCSVCHSVTRVTSAHKTADQWKATVERMINHGAQLSAQEEQTLVDYLAQNYK